MENKKGKLSIHSENIFPIIKKWLYSDHDIFIRELISNSSDAITKMKRLVSAGETKALQEDYEINVIYDKDNEILHIKDNGLGMTADEIEEYINKIAFSGAEDFVKKFKDKADEEQIIGHFGLGFYSAFMVASKVTIDTLSYKDGAEPAFWSCDGGTDFNMSKGERTDRGTTVSLHLSEDGKDFKNEYKIKNTIHKYCSFMPYPIYFEVLKEKNDEDKQVEEKEKKPLNITKPLYLETPSSVKEEEYRNFYRDTFVDFKEPLFWIHLNMDYPFRLKGILYFPKISSDFGELDGVIKLYNSQVYVADNIKEVIPEFLMLLKGVIDCPDLPLNVSRSFLQNDGFVDKISDYITKKVADKLTGLFKTDRENYEKYWDDISVFIKYGILKESKFYDKVKSAVLYKTVEGKHKDLETLVGNTDTENIVYYTDNSDTQSEYIELLKAGGKDIISMEDRIDSAFISFIEGEYEKIKFKRVDSDISELLDESEDNKDIKQEPESKESEQKETSEFKDLEKSFIDTLGIEKLKIDVKRLKTKDTCALIMLSEESRRMADMMKLYSGSSGIPEFPMEETLVLNMSNELVTLLIKNDLDEDNKKILINQIYDLAQLSGKKLKGERMTAFVKRTQDIILNSLK